MKKLVEHETLYSTHCNNTMFQRTQAVWDLTLYLNSRVKVEVEAMPDEMRHQVYYEMTVKCRFITHKVKLTPQPDHENGKQFTFTLLQLWNVFVRMFWMWFLDGRNTRWNTGVHVQCVSCMRETARSCWWGSWQVWPEEHSLLRPRKKPYNNLNMKLLPDCWSTNKPKWILKLKCSFRPQNGRMNALSFNDRGTRYLRLAP